MFPHPSSGVIIVDFGVGAVEVVEGVDGSVDEFVIVELNRNGKVEDATPVVTVDDGIVGEPFSCSHLRRQHGFLCLLFL